MLTAIINTCKSFLNRIQDKINKFTKPATATIAVGAISDLPRSKSDLIIDNAILRQQVIIIILKRSVKRPKFTNGDRVRLILLARLTNFWQSALHIVEPETLLRWHRDLFRRYWKRKSKPKNRKPRIPQETIDLIKQMAVENPRWGAKKIQGELLKLEIYVHKRTIKRHLTRVMRIRVRFPKSRPPHRFWLVEHLAGKRSRLAQESLRRLQNGRFQLTYVIEQPRLNERYQLHWEW